MKVLIVDNNTGILNVLCEYLTENGIQCDTAENYNEAMDQINNEYDVLFLDYKLNGDSKSGAHVAREFISVYKKQIRVIIMSAYEEVPHVEGVERYIRKDEKDFYKVLVDLVKEPPEPNQDDLIDALKKNTEVTNLFRKDLEKYRDGRRLKFKIITGIVGAILAFGTGLVALLLKIITILKP